MWVLCDQGAFFDLYCTSPSLHPSVHYMFTMNYSWMSNSHHLNFQEKLKGTQSKVVLMSCFNVMGTCNNNGSVLCKPRDVPGCKVGWSFPASALLHQESAPPASRVTWGDLFLCLCRKLLYPHWSTRSHTHPLKNRRTKKKKKKQELKPQCFQR